MELSLLTLPTEGVRLEEACIGYVGRSIEIGVWMDGGMVAWLVQIADVGSCFAEVPSRS
jgi:hypothetical protein